MTSRIDADEVAHRISRASSAQFCCVTGPALDLGDESEVIGGLVLDGAEVMWRKPRCKDPEMIRVALRYPLSKIMSLDSVRTRNGTLRAERHSPTASANVIDDLPLANLERLFVADDAVMVVNTDRLAEVAYNALCVENLLGFDVEATFVELPTGKANRSFRLESRAATVQLASRDGAFCFVLERLSIRARHDFLFSLLADPHIVKAHVDCTDAHWMSGEARRHAKTHRGPHFAAIADLREAEGEGNSTRARTKRAGLGWIDLHAPGLQPGLRVLVAETLKLRLDKSMRLSDWRARRLSAEQIEYAALDAVCHRAIAAAHL